MGAGVITCPHRLVILLLATLVLNQVDLSVCQQVRKENSFFSLIATKLIRVYQLVFSNRQGEVCNFTPSCSNYAYEAIKKYGLRGVLMTMDRLERCNYFAWQYKDKYYEVKWDEGRGDRLYDPVE
ncbi:MAG: membrane protein insertion efficiency factor YidD [bacterium]|nr:membrane protein insertion efficiency factor YidD [bacterium]